MRRFGLALALIVLCLVLSAPTAAAGPCDDLDETSMKMSLGGDRDADVHLDLPPIERPATRGTLSIRPGANGAVSVRSWKEDRVLVCARVIASGRDEESARDVARRVHVDFEGREIRVEGPEPTRRVRWAVSMTVFVPERTDLSVRTVNGPIRLDGVRGAIELEATNGPIEVKRAGGDVRGRTTNGPIRVQLDGSRWEGEGLDLETVNGPVTISVPDDYSAELIATTQNGPLVSAWGMSRDRDRERHRHSIRTTLGKGGATIRVATKNGPARIERM
jgi:DUF4097 and DUF4098 domain-containing protein YvlB